MTGMALAEELEAALIAALEDNPEPELNSRRTVRLAEAEADAEAPAAGAPVDPAPTVVESEYLAKIKSYGPFPQLLPAHKDFRPILALSVFAGFLGLDRFYRGNHISGFLKLATAGGFGIWWIADIFAILSGRVIDKDGHRFTGEKKQLAVAWALTIALFAGLTLVAVNAAAPAVTAFAGTVQDTLFPKPAPVPTWKTVADIKGTSDPTVLQVKGDGLRLTYDFPRPVYAFLLKEGDPAVSAQTLLLKDTGTRGVKEISITPGKYQLVIRSDGADWTVKAEELGIHN
jgi:TM2 domain-containing membrane protein YozV